MVIKPAPRSPKMEQLIPVINRLQDVMGAVGASSASTGVASIDLPQIAVVGSQSVGKSSVLESIVGKDFLPRGAGIVTRRPLILQLRNLSPPDSQAREDEDGSRQGDALSEVSAEIIGGRGCPPGLAEWGEFGHSPGSIFEDFEVIRAEIERETERLTGRNKGLSPEPILLKIYSPHVIDLTLIDLPGITKVPVGDQPADIEMQIRKMIMSFISKPNCIILAVTAANTDLANSDALQMAREVHASVGVITKCDLMDADTDALDMLMGKIYPLRKGYVGVVCRSQKDINKKTDIREAVREEERFFRTHPAYRPIAHRCGTSYLAVLLNQILMFHIQDTLPELKQRIQALVLECEGELASSYLFSAYGDALMVTHGNKGALLLHFFSKFARNFQDAIEGRLSSIHMSNQLSGGARISYIFHDWFGKALSMFDPLDGLCDMEIRTAIRNATGPKASLFVPEGAFEILVRKQILRLEQPALQCVEQVYEELQRIVEKCELPEVARFSYLRQRILDVVKSVLKRCLTPTNQMISNLIQMELAYFNTNHPDFVGGSSAISAKAVSARAALSSSVQHVLTPPNHLANPSQPPPAPASPKLQQERPNNTVSYSSNPPPPSSLDLRQQDKASMIASSRSGPAPGRNLQMAQQSLEPLSSNPVNVPLPNNGSGGPPHSGAGSGGFLSYFIGNRAGNQAMASTTSTTIDGPTTKSALGENDEHGRDFGQGQPIRYHQSARHFQYHSRPAMSQASPFGIATQGLALGEVRLPQVPSVVAPPDAPSEREKTEIDLIKMLIISYFNIVRKNVADYVPKSVMSFMVNTAKDVIQRELVSQLYKEDLFDELLREGQESMEARRRCVSTLESLRTATQIVSQIRDFDLED